MAYTIPTIADFKAKFVRDFPYGSTTATVMDIDITNAIADAGCNINNEIFLDQAEFTLAYLYLAAHCLVTSINAAGLGVAGSFNWLTVQKSVGEVSETYMIPQWVKENKVLGYLTTTPYGAKYCSIVAPRLVANVWTSHRHTLP